MDGGNITLLDVLEELTLPGSPFMANNINIDENTFEWFGDISARPTDEEIEAKRVELQNALPMKRLREGRDMILQRNDRYGLADYPFSSDTKKQEWLAYRQALRDFPNTQTPQLDTEGNLTNITWPTEPTGS